MVTDDKGKHHPRTIMEDHITLVSEPGGVYLGHVTPKGKDAVSTADAVYEVLEEHGLLNTLQYVGGDSTNVNTGAVGGAMYLLEKRLKRRLVRLVCQLHTNELPLRHVIEDIDGPTSGKNSFAGKLSSIANQ